MTKKHVFISYLHDDRARVKQLCNALERAGEPVWSDERILGGQDWKHEIGTAIEEAYAFVICFSSNLEKRTSSGVFPELEEAIEIYRQLAPGNIFVIPLRLDQCNIPPVPIGGHRDLRNLQHLDLFPNMEPNLERLLTSIRASPFHPGTCKEPDGEKSRQIRRESFVKWLIDEVDRHFQRKDFDRICSAITGKLEFLGLERQTLLGREQIVAALVRRQPSEAIACLRTALLETFRPGRYEGDKIRKMWDTGEAIMGLLVLSGVDDQWAEDMAESLNGRKISYQFDLPVSTLVGAEAGRARVQRKAALLCPEEGGLPSRGKHSFPVTVLESGPLPLDHARDLKKQLYTQLRKDKSAPEFTRREDDIALNQLLLERALENRAPYLVVDLDRAAENQHEHLDIVLQQLNRDLSNLAVLILYTGDKDSIIVLEEAIQEAVSLFFETQRSVLDDLVD